MNGAYSCGFLISHFKIERDSLQGSQQLEHRHTARYMFLLKTFDQFPPDALTVMAAADKQTLQYCPAQLICSSASLHADNLTVHFSNQHGWRLDGFGNTLTVR